MPFIKGYRMTVEHKLKISLSLKGKIRTEEMKKKYSEANKGKKLPEWHKRKISLGLMGKFKGEKSSLWRGGVSSENKRIRVSTEYRLWRESVFSRDNWTCQDCKKRGGELHPHHLKPFSLFPELRFAIDNGLTLCAACHHKTDTWGMRYDDLKAMFKVGN